MKKSILKVTILLSLLVLMSGCASKIMQGFVGKDIRQVVLDYGNPVNAMDMGNGIRAFQWKMTKSYTTPTYVDSYSRGTGHGSSYNTGYRTNYSMNAYVNTNTVISGGHTIDSSCLYTLFARWDKGRRGWIVTGFKKPKLMCE